MPAQAQAQTSIYETTLENVDLENALEERQKAKEAAAKTRSDLKTLDDKVKALIAISDIADAPVRCGRFVISRRHVKGKTVQFETEPTTRLQISLLDNDE